MYYECAQNCRFVPRCILCDLESTAVAELRCSAVGRLFNPDYCITGTNGAGNNWARGYWTEGAELIECVMEAMRNQAESCDCLQGFQLVHSIGGGSGSGMGSLLLNRVCDEYPDRIINTFSVIPSDKVSETVVEPYNAVLSLKEMISSTDETICFDNQALYDICIKTLKISHPTIGDLNHLVSMTMAGVTTGFRYPGQLNTDLRKLMTNMCPFPRLKFFIPGYAPLHSRNNNKEYENFTVNRLVQQLFNPAYQMGTYDVNCGKYLTCAAIFRGLVSSRDVEAGMAEIQSKNKDLFCKWIPNNIKTAICDIPPRGMSASATFLANTSSITKIFDRISGQFDAMYDKRAFVHWYTGEGMEESEFTEARESVRDLCEEYNQACSDGADDDTCLFPESEDDECSVCSECDDPVCACVCEKPSESC